MTLSGRALCGVVVACPWLLASCASAPAPSVRSAVPSVLLILVDDLGWQDLGASSQVAPDPAHAHFRTPNVDRLAREGTLFTQAYAAAPVCTPTRVSLMTGQMPARHRATYWTLFAGKDQSSKHPRLEAPKWAVDGLPADWPTLADRLEARGYRTIHVGKAHWGAEGTLAADPLQLGFLHNVAGHAAGAPGSYLSEHHFKESLRDGKPDADSVWDVPDLEAWWDKGAYLTEALAEEARRQLRPALDAGEPFYLSFCPYAVHAPLMANARYAEHYAGMDRREIAYATMVESVDAAVGVLLRELEAAGRLDDTLVIYASDNGGLSASARGGTPHTHNSPLRSGKGSAYEGGIRVPTILRWPKVAPAGVECTAPIVTMDLTATILAATGAEPLPQLDGIDLAPLVLGDPTSGASRPLLWHMPHLWGPKGPGLEPFTALRDGNLKLIFFHDSPPGAPRLELYDLAVDPSETHDLAGERPAEVDRLAGRMRALATEVGARPSIRLPERVEVEWPGGR